MSFICTDSSAGNWSSLQYNQVIIQAGFYQGSVVGVVWMSCDCGRHLVLGWFNFSQVDKF